MFFLTYIDTLYHTSIILKNLCKSTILSIIGQYFCFFFIEIGAIHWMRLSIILVFAYPLWKKKLHTKRFCFYLTYYSTPLLV